MNVGLARVFIALALISISSMGRAASDWTLNGYALEDGTEWFSLRARDGTSTWVSAGKPGPVTVKHFDRATLTLVIETRGQTEHLAMPEARIGEALAPVSAKPLALPQVALPTLTPLPPGPDGKSDAAWNQARESLEKIQVAHAAVRVEQEEAQRARDVALAAPHRKGAIAAQAEANVSQNPRNGAPLTVTTMNTTTDGEPDWAEIYRQTARRRATYDALLAEQRLRRESRR